MCCVLSHSVMSDSLRHHGLQPTRLLCPWDFPDKNAGVGCPFLLQGLFPRLKPSLLPLLHWQADSLSLCHLGRYLECAGILNLKLLQLAVRETLLGGRFLVFSLLAASSKSFLLPIFVLYLLVWHPPRSKPSFRVTLSVYKEGNDHLKAPKFISLPKTSKTHSTHIH